MCKYVWIDMHCSQCCHFIGIIIIVITAIVVNNACSNSTKSIWNVEYLNIEMQVTYKSMDTKRLVCIPSNCYYIQSDCVFMNSQIVILVDRPEIEPTFSFSLHFLLPKIDHCMCVGFNLLIEFPLTITILDDIIVTLKICGSSFAFNWHTHSVCVCAI